MKINIENYYLDNTSLPIELEELRSVTFEVYNLTDFLLDLVLIVQIIKPISDKLENSEIAVITEKINKFLLEIDLFRKLKLAKDNKVIKEIEKNIGEIATLRNQFSHQRVYFKELERLKKDKTAIHKKIKSFKQIMASLLKLWIEYSEEEGEGELTQTTELLDRLLK